MQTPVTRYFEGEIAVSHSYNHDTINHNRAIEFINYSKHSIVMVDRNNIPVTLQPVAAGAFDHSQRVEIRTTYRIFDQSNIKSMKDNLDSFTKTMQGSTQDRHHVLGIVNDNIDERYNNQRLCFEIVRTIKLSDLGNAGAIYDRGSGFLICKDGMQYNYIHPESVEGRRIASHSDYTKGRPNGLLIEIVDNNGLYRERFTFAHNQVVRLSTIMDTDREDGVYVTTVEDEGSSVSRTETVVYSMEEASKKFGLYVTREEALTAGSPDTISKATLLNAQRELEAVKHANSVAEADMKRRANEREEEISRLKSQLEIQKASRSDYYEERSSVRKDSSEFFKFIPALVTAVVGLFALFSFRRT